MAKSTAATTRKPKTKTTLYDVTQYLNLNP